MKTPPVSSNKEPLQNADAPQKRKLEGSGELSGVRVKDARRKLDFGDEPKRYKITFESTAEIFTRESKGKY